jgi:hypothetical protein
MQFSTLLGLLLISLEVISASPLVINGPIIGDGAFKKRKADICKSVENIVDLLKLKQATPFCSSWLSIQTSTQYTTQTLSPTTVFYESSSDFETTIAYVTSTGYVTSKQYD